MEKKSFKPDLESVKKIQGFVENNIKGEKSDKKRLFKINILIEEIVVNIVNYAFKDMQDGIIDIEIDTSDDEISLRVFDNGLPFNPLEAEEPDINAPLKDRNPGGLGIFFVKQIAKSFKYSYKNSKNCISLIIEP
jgi:serine/threonine-protein kinase RsbW